MAWEKRSLNMNTLYKYLYLLFYIDKGIYTGVSATVITDQ